MGNTAKKDSCGILNCTAAVTDPLSNAEFRDCVVAYKADVNVWHAIASILDCSWCYSDDSDTVSECRMP